MRIDGNAFEIGLATRARDTDRDFAAIGDQHAPERHALQLGFRFSRKARRPSCPSAETLCEAIALVVTPITSSGWAPAISRIRVLALAIPVGLAARTSAILR